METVLLVVHIIITLALIGIVLIQRSESDGFGLGSGGGSNFMTGRAVGNFLTRTTAILATLFILNSLALGVIASSRSNLSVMETIAAENGEPADEASDAGDKPVDNKAAKSDKKPDEDRKPKQDDTKAEPAVPTDG